jgi:hypothetical protein
VQQTEIDDKPVSPNSQPLSDLTGSVVIYATNAVIEDFLEKKESDD